MLTAKIIAFWAIFALIFAALFLFGRLADRTVRKPDEPPAKDGGKPAAEPKEKKGGAA